MPECTPPPPDPDLRDRVEALLGHHFLDPATLALALGPADAAPQAALGRQRLRFLGDAVWDYAVSAAVVRRWPQATAGELTRRRAIWSRSSGLARLAREAGLEGGDPAEGDRALAERFEALLGAAVQEAGLAAIQALADRVVGADVDPAGAAVDAKSALQMRAQALGAPLPLYRLVERHGPAHRPSFRLRVSVTLPDGVRAAEADGASRQAAEQRAAARLLEALAPETHNMS